MVISLLLVLAFQPQAAQLASLYQQQLDRQSQEHGEDSPQAAQAAMDLGLFLMKNQIPGATVPLQRAYRILQNEASLESLVAALPVNEAEPHLKALSRSAEPQVAARALTRLAQNDPSCAFIRQAVALQPTIPRLNDLGQCQQKREELKPAIASFRRALALDPQDKDIETTATLNNLASALLEAQLPAEGERYQRRAHTRLLKSLGPNHHLTALAASNLADILTEINQKAEARRLYRQAFETFRLRLGPSHPWTREAAAALAARP